PAGFQSRRGLSYDDSAPVSPHNAPFPTYKLPWAVRTRIDETALIGSTGVFWMEFLRRRRDFITLLGGAAAWPLAARAQQREKMRRIGVLIAGLSEKDSEGQLRMAAFRQGLQNLGWVEGRNVHIEERWPGGNNERLRSFAAELVGMRPDAIFAGNEAA